MAQLQRLAIAPTQFQLPHIALSRAQDHYLRHVLRLQTGDRFIALNGQGQGWLAQLQQDPAQAQVLEPLAFETELPVPVTLLAAPAKGNHFEQVIRGCTELGVTQVVPLLSERTLLNPSTRKLERWRRIAVEAAEQSLRPARSRHFGADAPGVSPAEIRGGHWGLPCQIHVCDRAQGPEFTQPCNSVPLGRYHNHDGA